MAAVDNGFKNVALRIIKAGATPHIQHKVYSLTLSALVQMLLQYWLFVLVACLSLPFCLSTYIFLGMRIYLWLLICVDNITHAELVSTLVAI